MQKFPALAGVTMHVLGERKPPPKVVFLNEIDGVAVAARARDSRMKVEDEEPEVLCRALLAHLRQGGLEVHVRNAEVVDA